MFVMICYFSIMLMNEFDLMLYNGVKEWNVCCILADIC